MALKFVFGNMIRPRYRVAAGYMVGVQKYEIQATDVEQRWYCWVVIHKLGQKCYLTKFAQNLWSRNEGLI